MHFSVYEHTNLPATVCKHKTLIITYFSNNIKNEVNFGCYGKLGEMSIIYADF